ncbi:MAG: hypothetical protein U9Q08_01255 [Candidatus Omnitrophota bacterium]|nr:hypothetical protein [Candidatus Omnitrophota bacterium]
MPYDNSLDERLFSKSCETETERLTVSVHSYNKGIKKLQVSRENKNDQDEFKFAKLGRMTKEEIEPLLPLLQEALNYM